jgi:hypothetical protein
MPAQVIKITGAHQHKLSGLYAACVGLLLAYFLHFALSAERAGFGDDEMMNLYSYWLAGPFKFFCLAQLLSGSRAVAFLVALAMCYHGQWLIWSLEALSSTTCCVASFISRRCLTTFVSARKEWRCVRDKWIFLALYVCALNSKEMAVSLPVIVFIYEALKCPRLGTWKEFAWHNWYVAIPSFVAALVTAIYICGEAVLHFGPYQLAVQSISRYATETIPTRSMEPISLEKSDGCA